MSGQHHHDNGKRRQKGSSYGKGYKLDGAIPWPELGDGTPYLPGMRVAHHQLTDERGTIQWVKWSDSEGNVIEPGKRLDKRGNATPGEWWAVVSWESRRPTHPPEDPLVRLPLAHLIAAPTEP